MQDNNMSRLLKLRDVEVQDDTTATQDDVRQLTEEEIRQLKVGQTITVGRVGSEDHSDLLG